MELVTSSIFIVPFIEPRNNEVARISMEIGEAKAYRARGIAIARINIMNDELQRVYAVQMDLDVYINVHNKRHHQRHDKLCGLITFLFGSV